MTNKRIRTAPSEEVMHMLQIFNKGVNWRECLSAPVLRIRLPDSLSSYSD